MYVAHVALHKFVQFVDGNALNGAIRFPRLRYEALRGPGVWLMMGLVTLSLLLAHEARRTLFLAWPLLFNLPLFLFFFSDGMRHVAPVTASLFVATLPLIGEGAFYQTLGKRRGRAFGVVSGWVALWFLLHWADGMLLGSERWRYWTPFLDPAPFAWYLS